MYSHVELNRELEKLRRRYVRELHRLYGGEIEHLNVLPEMARVAQAPALKSAFQVHFEKTQAHVERLRCIFAGLGLRPVDLKPQAAPEATQVTRRLPAAWDDSASGEAVLIAATRNLERHEVAGYLLALNCAQILQDHTAARLLEQTLREEYEFDHILSTLDASGLGCSIDRVERSDLVDQLAAWA